MAHWIDQLSAQRLTLGNGAQPTPNYTIAPGRPQIAGYAAELARQHGLSLAQIASTLRERGIAEIDE